MRERKIMNGKTSYSAFFSTPAKRVKLLLTDTDSPKTRVKCAIKLVGIKFYKKKRYINALMQLRIKEEIEASIKFKLTGSSVILLRKSLEAEVSRGRGGR